MRDDDAVGVLRDAVQLIAEAVTEIVGFREATIRVRREDDTFEMIALAGNEEARQALIGRREPIASLQYELDHSDVWGLLRFVPAERAPQELIDDPDPLFVPDIEVSDDPDAWHPLDLLFAPFYDDAGQLRGTMSIDLPVDGKRPDQATRDQLQKYAAQAGRAVLSALEREEVAEQFRLAETTREVVRRASAQLSLVDIFQASERALVEGFRAHGIWIQTFGSNPGDQRVARIFASDGREVRLGEELARIAETAAHHCWRTQESVIVAGWRPRPAMLDEHQHQVILDFIESIDLDSLVFTPMGAGPECLGNLVLTRRQGQAGDWTEVERAALLDIGEDIGRAILSARNSDREQALIAELRALDGYKSRMITTLAHELTEPLHRIVHTIGALEEAEHPSRQVTRVLRSMARGTVRMSRVVEDLTLLAKVGNPEHPLAAAPVDLRSLVEEAVDLTDVAASRKGLRIEHDIEGRAVHAWGDLDELDRVVVNLVSNAVKYTPDDGRVCIRLARVGDQVRLEVSDTGLGISPEDQQRLFSEFFRSSNPVALQQPGTGLGLAIVARIVDRHGGRIEVESALGDGSTFRVTLPAAQLREAS